MGRMQDALKKAAEERERKRLMESHGAPAAPPPAEDVPSFDRPLEARPEPRTEPRSVAAPPRAPERRGKPERAPTPHPVAPSAPHRHGVDERLIVFHLPSDERAEELRKVRANLLSFDPRPRTIMVTSGAPREGKSLLAANLALTLLEMGEREVLLVDANLRHPELASLLGTRSSPGVCEVIAADAAAIDSAIVDTGVPGLKLLPAGAAGVAAARQLQPDMLKGMLDRLRDRFAFVIVDTPATCDYADAVLMSNDVDGVLVVVKVGGGRRKATRTALDALEGSKARILGTVIVTGT
jgi:capsular exopolysaccharide synthesis family protein